MTLESAVPNLRKLYVAERVPAVMRDFLSSFTRALENCNDDPQSALSIPVKVLDPDLHSTFPPPYSLEVK